MQILKAISGSNANALFVQWELTKNCCEFYNLLSKFCGGFQANSLDLVPTGRVVKCQKVYTDQIFSANFTPRKAGKSQQFNT